MNSMENTETSCGFVVSRGKCRLYLNCVTWNWPALRGAPATFLSQLGDLELAGAARSYSYCLISYFHSLTPSAWGPK